MGRPSRQIVLLFGAAAALGSTPSARAAEQEETEARAALKGEGEGSLKNPMKLDSEAALAKLCDALEGPRRAQAEGDAYARGLARHELKLRSRLAQRSVYQIRVAPGGFKVDDYRYERGRLPLKLDRSLVALDGAATLSVIRHKGGMFEVAPEQAWSLAQQIESKQVALEIVFRIDAEPRGLGGCFSYPKSAVYNLQIEPLSYALLGASSNQVLAGSTTPAMKRLQTWLDPGLARLELAVAGVEGTVDAEQLRAAIEGHRNAIEACMKPVIDSAYETAVLGYAVTIAPSGALAGVHREAEAIDHESVGPCVDRALASVAVTKAQRGSSAHLAITVARAVSEDDEQQPDL